MQIPQLVLERDVGREPRSAFHLPRPKLDYFRRFSSFDSTPFGSVLDQMELIYRCPRAPIRHEIPASINITCTELLREPSYTTVLGLTRMVKTGSISPTTWILSDQHVCLLAWQSLTTADRGRCSRGDGHRVSSIELRTSRSVRKRSQRRLV